MSFLNTAYNVISQVITGFVSNISFKPEFSDHQMNVNVLSSGIAV
jgi:hypothetical protein